VTLAGRTSTTGNLIVVGQAIWNTVTGTTIPAPTDNKANSYATNHTQVGNGSGSSFVDAGIAYNMGGTRGASHTISQADGPGSTVNSLSATEWSGIATSPTVTTGTNTGSGTTPSVSASPGSSSLMVAVVVPDYGTGVTHDITADAPATRRATADLDNTNQAHAQASRESVSGATTINFTLTHTGAWAAVAAAWTEAASAGGFRSRIAGGLVVNG
jgi:hypothetical protein